MAAENVFISSAVLTVATAGIMLYLYHMTESWFWKRVWLLSVFVSLYYGYAVERVGWQNFVVHNGLADLAFGMVQALMWVSILLFGYLLLSLLYHALRSMMDIAKGKNSYDEIHKIR